MSDDEALAEAEETARQDDPRAFFMTVVGIAIMVAIAFGFGLLLKTPPLKDVMWNLRDVAYGGLAATPMALLLLWFSKASWPPIARFRDSQIEFFAGIGFKFTPLRIAVMSFGAGLSEEMLFRGVFQTWTDRYLPFAAALILPNIVFALLHMRSLLYAAIAGIIGVYMGLLFAATGNLLTPIVAHALYDAIAFDYARRAIAARRSTS
ncbi:MAG: CPBP family intramembrane metalloprotease [Alphaproteobacteria bacterium]|nr:CPBP family intramembrane metalloprotease [Alphaproteobacteria bacterium]